MLLRILGFELAYRAKRPATYLYFAVLFLLCYLAIAVDEVSIGGASGQLKDDAAWIVAFQSLIMSVIGIFFSSAVMGVPILRDFEHRTSAMMFTAPIKKADYLLGRFLGSFIVLALILTAIPLGLMTGRLIGEYMPWGSRDFSRFLPEFHASFYWHAYFMFILPNAFISGCIFFMGGALSKRLLFVFLQGIGLFTLYLAASQMVGKIENREFAALLDPFGQQVFAVSTQYWSVAQQNLELVSWTGLPLQNRLIWLAVGLLCLLLTYVFFSFTSAARRQWKKKKQETPDQSPEAVSLPSDLQLTYQGLQVQFKRLSALVRLYYREIVGSVPFLGIVIFGFIYLVFSSTNFNEVFGTPTLPTTYLMLELLSTFDLFFFIIVIFYAGELIWRERDLRVNQIYDTLPIPDALGLVSKFIAFMLVHITLLLLLILLGMGIQAAMGYYKFEVGIYLTEMFSSQLSWLALFTLLAFFVQVMINNKFLGHGMMILIFIVNIILANLGLEHNLIQFGSGSLEDYSDMNIYGDSFIRFSWFKAYWFGFTLVLLGLAIAFSVRGTDTVLRTRTKLAGMRFVRPLLIFTLSALLIFGGTGAYIYYVTTVVNEFTTSDEAEERRANYEKELKQYEYIAQPKIVETKLLVDIYPMERDYIVEGYYILKNKGDSTISSLHIQGSTDEDLAFEPFTFERMDSLPDDPAPASLAESFEDYNYDIYELKRPLLPGDSLKMYFKGKFDTEGFKSGGRNNSVIRNGTFFNNSSFPSFGYSSGFELSSDDTRKKYDLEPKERQLDRDDPRGLVVHALGDDADRIRFDITMGTRADQIAIAPGYLQRQWEANGRSYYRYKMDAPILNFYSMISARYEVIRDHWIHPSGDSVNLEIYYHKGHEYNIDRMMEGMRHSLDYFSEIFSPFQYRQMRIMEFPRYATFAQSFANTVPFSEGIGFIVDIDDEKDVDITYYVTAHEVAHQWWAHQVIPSNTKGSSMIVESLAQYSALMLMKQSFSTEKMQQYLREELDRYLSGRRGERKKEQPLVLVENQQYIHYGKGAVQFFALQDYVGEDSLNKALSRFIDDWAFKEGLYPTTKDFMSYIYEVTPDSLTGIVRQMFEEIVFYENKMLQTEMAKTEEGSYEVDLSISAVKYEADSLGNEEAIDFDEWIYLGLYGKDKDGQDSLIYYRKHFFDSDTTKLSLQVDTAPVKAAIDPIHLLIDKHPQDNEKTIKLRE